MTISALGTLGAGVERETTFTGILTLTYNATSLILPGAADIVTAVGDVARWRSLGSGNWKCVSYLRANGALIVNTLVQPALTLKQSAAPVPTAEGDIQWDTDDDAIVVGDGAATRIFVPLPASTAAGDVLYLSAAKVLTRIAKGTALQALLMNAGATAPNWATLPFTKFFETNQQTITSSGSLTIAHGLGVKPKLVEAVLQFTTAASGYSIGDELVIGPHLSTGNAASRGQAIVCDATNIFIRFGSDSSDYYLLAKDTGVATSLPVSNFRLVVRAWA